MAEALRALGGCAEEAPDGLIVEGRSLRGGTVDGCGDHRVVMSAAVLATACQGPVTILGAEAADKYTMTYGDTEEEKKKHLVRTSATPMGMKTSYTYDAYGNATATVNQKSASDPFIRTEAEYNAPSGTDAEGNALDNRRQLPRSNRGRPRQRRHPRIE